jgi:hypothetical protein
MPNDSAFPAQQDDHPVFTADWFDATAKPVWSQFIPDLPASRVIEVGSYEGASACYLIAQLGARAPLEIHCVDPWEGTANFAGGEVDMREVEARFRRNTGLLVERSRHPVTLEIHKGFSGMVLARLLAQKGQRYFDLVYIDGSHEAPDVLADAVLGFQLLRTGGIMVFDDYLWRGGDDNLNNPALCPKLAIDAFINCNFSKLRMISAPLYQIYLQKTAD